MSLRTWIGDDTADRFWRLVCVLPDSSDLNADLAELGGIVARHRYVRERGGDVEPDPTPAAA